MSEPTVTVSRRGAERILAGHPWIYRSDIVGKPDLAGGEIVAVLDGRSWFRGRATYSSKSQIALRMLTREERPCDRDFFRERLAQADAFRRQIYPGVESYRVVHGEADLLPGLVVDRYGDVLVVQLLTQTAEAQRALWQELLQEHFQPRAIIERSDAKVRLLEGLEQRKAVLVGEAPERVEIMEGDVKLHIDPFGGQKTGTFLDQRENHIAVSRYARGKGLDCFSYVGGFALQLARGCDEVTAVEISEAAAEQVRQNAALNGFERLKVEVANAFDFLKAKTESPERYDIVVLDPPAFAKSKSSVPAAERGYKEINLRALQLLNPGGILVSASCSYHIAEEHFEDILHAAAADARREVQIVERRGAGRDHPVLMGVRETRYLKCYVLRGL